MSCPTCQVAGRRLPSLPLGYVAKSRKKILCKDLDDIRALNSAALNIDCIGSITRSKRMTTPPLEDLEGVEEYLLQHSNVIEEFVMKNISQDQLERWLIRKSKMNKTFNRAESDTLRSFSNWKFCVHKDKRKLLESLTKEIHQDKNRTFVISELVKNISKAIHASRHNLYLVDESGKFLTCYADNQASLTNLPQQEIKSSTTISSYVARERKLVYVTEVLGDERFPSGSGRDGTDLSIICHPICENNGNLFGVVEFVREASLSSFAEEDVEITCSYLTWGSIALHYAEVAQKLETQSNILQFVNKCVSVIGAKSEYNQIVSHITDFGKEETSSDHFILYVWDKVGDAFQSEMTDFTSLDENNERKPLEFRTDGNSIPGEVSRYSKIRNVKNAYKDELFSRAIDQKTGSTTNTILAAPIIVDGLPYGVLEYINKSTGVYTELDEEAITLCALFYGLATKYQIQHKQLLHTTNEVHVLKEVLKYHGIPRKKEIREIRSPSIVMGVPDDFYKFSFNFYQNPHQNSRWFVMMAEDLLTKCKVDYCEKMLVRFTATVKKHYRDLPYHNWEHAFSVAHFMYLVLEAIPDKIPPIERLALFFGCICHDLDHRGRNNAFFVMTKHPLSKLYDASVMEYHHFYMAQHILNQPECNIFKSLKAEEREKLLSLMKKAILATDLMEHFKYRKVLRSIVDGGTFDWNNAELRHLACFVLMTNCDLCGSCKPFEISRICTAKVFDEFYSQGDEEISLGFTPIPMFTRKNEMALNQAGFINAIVKPCVNILKNIIPVLSPVEDQINLLIDQWEDCVRQKVEKDVSEEDLEQLRVPGSKLQEKTLSFARYDASVKE